MNLKKILKFVNINQLYNYIKYKNIIDLSTKENIIENLKKVKLKDETFIESEIILQAKESLHSNKALKIVEYFLDNYSFKRNILLDLFCIAYKKDNTNLIKLILTRENIKKENLIGFNDFDCFFEACRTQNVDLIGFYLREPTIENFDIDYKYDRAFNLACKNGKIKTIIELFNNKNIKKPDIYSLGNYGIKGAIAKNNKEVTNYLLDEQNFHIDGVMLEGLKSFMKIQLEKGNIEESEYNLIIEKIKRNGLNKDLKENLISRKDNNKKIKV